MKLPPHRRLFNFARRIVEAYSRDDVPLLSAAIAFYALLSIAPILIIALAVADAITDGEAVRANITSWLTEHVSLGVSQMIDDWVTASRVNDDSRFAVIVSVVVLLVSASRLFAHIRTALDRIWRIQSAPPPMTIFAEVRARVLGLGIVMLLGALLLSSLTVKVLLRMLAPRFGIDGIPFVWVLFDWSVYFLLVGGLVYIMYRRLPHAVVPRMHARRGAALTAVLLILGGEVISFYLARPGVTSSFGAAGSVMALVLWVYYATQVFLVGALFTWVFAQRGAKARRRVHLRRKRGSALKDKKPKPAPAESTTRLDVDASPQKARVAAAPDQPAPARELEVERATLADAGDSTEPTENAPQPLRD